MATLKGQGGFKGVNLIVEDRGAYSKDGKEVGHFLDVQVDQSLKKADKILSGDAKADTNPHLVSTGVKGKDGNTFVSHSTFYSTSQYDKIMDAAGKKVFDAAVPGKDDTHKVALVSADLTKNAKGSLIINTAHDMAESKNPYGGKNILEKQSAVTAAAREFRDAQREKAAPEAQAEAPQASVEDSPEMQ